ncbi:cytochrome P450 [Amycolatopsis jiangsuensis]|uniref:Cytochrome P450 n=1 Tax=Amycolatopsis jiangsuensis TaxID=1181879 RepID=A0A840J7F3_9PSEU|nr:cytochrome P450 [Amycolatopsis jiangsuensis]MBB4689307.1 cytochrome P450 [Amycolatopsis jiangsuensis]
MSSLKWALSRYDDIRTMLTDSRFSSDRRAPNYPRLLDGPALPAGARAPLINMDPPEHTVARRAVLGEFTVKRLAALRPRVQEIVDDHIDAMLAGPQPADLVQALSLPVPSLVICEMLGVPYTDHDYFQSQAKQLFSRTATQAERTRTHSELVGYLHALVETRAKDPADDLISRQLANTEDHEAVTALATVLLVAGHETTANMISLGTMTLLDHPEHLRTIRDDPAKTPAAVEELLRYFTIAEFGLSRVATADVEVGGVLIHAGEGVITLTNTANRDPRVFAQPDEIDIERSTRRHLAFGYGPHQCLGQNLARIELEIVFTTLFDKIPDIQPAVDTDTLPFKDDANIYGIHQFPVTWGAATPASA